MQQDERRLAAIMFTDIQGYTALTQENEQTALRLLERYRELVRPVLSRYGGREVKTMGDGSLIEFGSALEAAECAVEMQRVIHEYNQSAATKMVVRVGIHVGDVVHRGGDVFGDAVNIASRIEPLAKGGGVCVTGQVYYQVMNKLPLKAERIESGGLKNVSIPTEVYRFELPWEAEESSSGNREERRLAVLPLDNISPDPNDEYFAEGLHDELITSLSRVNGLEVIARTSVLRYKGGTKQVAAIGRELNVGSILEGSVRKAGNRIRVTAQLINASNEAHVWAETYDRQLDDIFAVQSDIAGKVADALRLKLSPRTRLESRRTANPEAYTLYLRGKLAATKLNKESLRKAIDYFERAVAIVPDSAECHAEIAQAWLLLGFFELLPSEDSFAKAKAAAEMALALNNNLPEGHIALGRLLRLADWKFEEADVELKRAVELAPGLAAAHAFRAQGLQVLRRTEEAEEEAKKALELDPFSVTTCQILGTVYLYGNEEDKAIELYQRALDIDPSSPFPMGNLGLAYVRKGEVEKGVALIEKAQEFESRNASSMNDLAYAYGRAGRTDDVKRILAELLQMRRETGRAAPSIAGVYVTLGDYDKAMDWLEEAAKEHSAYFGSVTSDFIFDPLRSHPRYVALMKKMGLHVTGAASGNSEATSNP
jgi:TolB-like protein/Flp pilus assembly protein TadD